MKYQTLLVSVSLFFTFALGACNPVQTAETVDIDWENVQAIESTEAMGFMLQLTRRLDYWHEGRLDTLRLRYVKPGVIEDQDANTFEVTPEEWKGMVMVVHQGIRAAQRHAPQENLDSTIFRSAPTEFYDDSLGNVQRYVYRFRIDAPTTLHAEVAHDLSQRYRE